MAPSARVGPGNECRRRLERSKLLISLILFVSLFNELGERAAALARDALPLSGERSAAQRSAAQRRTSASALRLLLETRCRFRESAAQRKIYTYCRLRV